MSIMSKDSSEIKVNVKRVTSVNLEGSTEVETVQGVEVPDDKEKDVDIFEEEEVEVETPVDDNEDDSDIEMNMGGKEVNLDEDIDIFGDDEDEGTVEPEEESDEEEFDSSDEEIQVLSSTMQEQEEIHEEEPESEPEKPIKRGLFGKKVKPVEEQQEQEEDLISDNEDKEDELPEDLLADDDSDSTSQVQEQTDEEQSEPKKKPKKVTVGKQKKSDDEEVKEEVPFNPEGVLTMKDMGKDFLYSSIPFYNIYYWVTCVFGMTHLLDKAKVNRSMIAKKRFNTIVVLVLAILLGLSGVGGKKPTNTNNNNKTQQESSQDDGYNGELKDDGEVHHTQVDLSTTQATEVASTDAPQEGEMSTEQAAAPQDTTEAAAPTTDITYGTTVGITFISPVEFEQLSETDVLNDPTQVSTGTYSVGSLTVKTFNYTDGTDVVTTMQDSMTQMVTFGDGSDVTTSLSEYNGATLLEATDGATTKRAYLWGTKILFEQFSADTQGYADSIASTVE